MTAIAPEEVHADLVAWGVLEADPPLRFTRRFRGMLARAARSLQEEAEGREGAPDADPLGRQVDVALREVGMAAGVPSGPSHAAFVRAVHVESLPEAVRRLIGV